MDAKSFASQQDMDDGSLSKDEIKLLDEAMVLFFLRNENVYLFDGDSSNFKITRPFDLTLAETYLKSLK